MLCGPESGRVRSGDGATGSSRSSEPDTPARSKGRVAFSGPETADGGLWGFTYTSEPGARSPPDVGPCPRSRTVLPRSRRRPVQTGGRGPSAPAVIPEAPDGTVVSRCPHHHPPTLRHHRSCDRPDPVDDGSRLTDPSARPPRATGGGRQSLLARLDPPTHRMPMAGRPRMNRRPTTPQPTTRPPIPRRPMDHRPRRRDSEVLKEVPTKHPVCKLWSSSHTGHT